MSPGRLLIHETGSQNNAMVSPRPTAAPVTIAIVGFSTLSRACDSTRSRWFTSSHPVGSRPCCYVAPRAEGTVLAGGDDTRVRLLVGLGQRFE